jgi:RNA polymerase sigma-70 factor (ECF subfamily)
LQNSTTYIESEVLQQIAKGDESAFRLLFNEHCQNIYGVAYMFTKSAPIAEDMIQEIFMKLWIKREQLPKVENFRNYLFIIARNHIFNELKKRSTDILFTNHLFEYFHDTKETPEKKLLQKEAEQIIGGIIERLPQQQKMIYRLSREEGLSRNEMADRLGIAPNTVRNHLARALEMIRHELQRDVNGLLLWICLIEISVP